MKRRGFLQGLVALVAAKPALEAMSKKLNEEVIEPAMEDDRAWHRWRSDGKGGWVRVEEYRTMTTFTITL